MAHRIFTPKDPPKSGKAKKLWDWFYHNNDPENGLSSLPDYLQLNHTGWKHKGRKGVPRYIINFNGTNFFIWDVEKTISKPLPNWQEWHLKPSVFLD